MIKKSLVSIALATSLFVGSASGVAFTQPVVAEASDMETVHFTDDDLCFDKITSTEGYAQDSKDGVMVIYKKDLSVCYFRHSMGCYKFNPPAKGKRLKIEYEYYGGAKTGSTIIENKNNKLKIVADVNDTTKADVDDIADEADKDDADAIQSVEDVVVCKHQSAENVTLTSSEKKGTLVVNKADITTATKLDKILKTGRKTTLKIKASSKKSAKNIIHNLQDTIGHANTYGLIFWYDCDKEGTPNDDKISDRWLKKNGSYYNFTISKKSAKVYSYLCTGFRKTIDKAYSGRKSGYTFAEGTHLCDYSQVFKVFVISHVIKRVHVHNHEIGDGKKDYLYGHKYSKTDNKRGIKLSMTLLKKMDNDSVFYWSTFAGDDMYGTFICEDFAVASIDICQAMGINDVKYKADVEQNHAWAVLNVKNYEGQVYKMTLDNGYYRYIDDEPIEESSAAWTIWGDSKIDITRY